MGTSENLVNISNNYEGGEGVNNGFSNDGVHCTNNPEERQFIRNNISNNYKGAEGVNINVSNNYKGVEGVNSLATLHDMPKIINCLSCMETSESLNNASNNSKGVNSVNVSNCKCEAGAK